MTKRDAKNLKIGDVVYDRCLLTKKGKLRKWRVYSPDTPFLIHALDRREKESERQHPYRVRVGIKARFGEWETISELELQRFTLNPNDSVLYYTKDHRGYTTKKNNV